WPRRAVGLMNRVSGHICRVSAGNASNIHGTAQLLAVDTNYEPALLPVALSYTAIFSNLSRPVTHAPLAADALKRTLTRLARAPAVKDAAQRRSHSMLWPRA